MREDFERLDGTPLGGWRQRGPGILKRVRGACPAASEDSYGPDGCVMFSGEVDDGTVDPIRCCRRAPGQAAGKQDP